MPAIRRTPWYIAGMKVRIRFAAVFLASVALTASTLAHPHVWVTAKAELIYGSDGRVTGVRHAWTFDDMYSAFATQGLESRTKGVFTREELEPVAKENIESLKEFDYFSFGKIDGKKIGFVTPTDYWLDYDQSLLTLHFVLPLEKPVASRTLTLEIYDPTYFVDFTLDKDDPAKLVGAPDGCKLSVGRPQEMSIAGGQRLLSQAQNPEALPQNWGANFANKIFVACP